MAIEMKMEFLNNDGAPHNLCEQDSNNFICVNLFFSVWLFFCSFFVSLTFVDSFIFVFFAVCNSFRIIINFREKKKTTKTKQRC